MTRQLDNILAKKICINIISILKKPERTIDKLKKKEKAKRNIQKRNYINYNNKKSILNKASKESHKRLLGIFNKTFYKKDKNSCINKREIRDKKSAQNKCDKSSNISMQFQRCRNTNSAKEYTKYSTL